jgi:hypothetical protein
VCLQPDCDVGSVVHGGDYGDVVVVMVVVVIMVVVIMVVVVMVAVMVAATEVATSGGDERRRQLWRQSPLEVTQCRSGSHPAQVLDPGTSSH